MKISPTTALLLAGLVCASAIRADESWRNKTSGQWNPKEVREILEHSPWARRISVMLIVPASQVKPCSGSSSCVRSDSFREPSASNAPMSGAIVLKGEQDLEVAAEKQRSQDRYTAPLGPGGSNAPLAVGGVSVIRWASAATIREALARMVPPSGKRMSAQQLAHLVAADAYVVYVDLRVSLSDVGSLPPGGILTPRMARRSFLVSKSTGRRIAALRIAPAPLPEFDDRKQMALAAYYVFFPKQKDGRAVLDERETEVRFECPLSPVPIRADFKLSRMEREGVPDF